MRVKSEIWVQAYLRTCNGQGCPAMLLRRGQADAGAIFIQILRANNTVEILGPAPAGFDDADRDRRWMWLTDAGPIDPLAARELIAREVSFDADLWLVEVECPVGIPFLEGQVVEN